MPHEPRVVAEGTRSVAVGGDAIGSLIITGDRNKVFLGTYEPLRDAYIDARPVFRRVRVKGFFEGRVWLTKEIDRFIAAEGSGYVIIEAAAGLGKTAYLAHLAYERHYVHHFSELARGAAGVEPALKSLAAQVLVAEQLVADADDALLPTRAAERPDFLASVLDKAARRRRAEGRGPLVVIIDGLDEAGTPDGQNVLGLPERAPDGVVFIVTTRPVDVALRVDGPRRVIPIIAEAEENLRDVRAYLDRRAVEPPLAHALNGGTQHLVDMLAARSHGVWVYLQYVLADLEAEAAAAARDGRPAALDLDDLPDGLWRYYARTWLRWRDRQDEFYVIDLPLLATLAAVQEPTAVSLLQELAGIAPSPRLKRLFTGRWRPFLAEEGPGPRYTPYHASLREFLEGRRGDLEDPTSEERDLADELADAWRAAHARIADRYLAAWGAGLGQLADPDRRDLDGGYGLRHVAAHLELSGRGEELHRLLACDAGGRNAWFAARAAVGDVAGYELDVDRAWRIAAQRPPAVALEVRYALLRGSVRAPAGSVSVEVMGALVAGGAWTRSQALDYAAWIDRPGDRARWLTALVAHLEGEARAMAWEEALRLVRALGIDMQKAQRFVDLAACTDGSQRGEMIAAAVAEVDDDPTSDRARVLAACAALTAEPRRSELLALALDAIEALDRSSRAYPLIAIGPSLTAGLRDRGRRLAEDIGDADLRAEAQFALEPPDADPVATVATHFGPLRRANEDSLCRYARAAALARDARTASAVFAARDRLTRPHERAAAIADVLPLLTPPDQVAAEAVLLDAVAELRGSSIPDLLADDTRIERLAERAPTADEHLLDALLRHAETCDDDIRGQALVAVAARLPPARRRAVLEAAERAVTRIGDETYRASTLAAISAQLAEPQRSRVWSAALRQATLSHRLRDNQLIELLASMPLACADDAEAAIAATTLHSDDADGCWSALAVRYVQLGQPGQAFAAVGKTSYPPALASALEHFPADLPEATVRAFMGGLGPRDRAWIAVLCAALVRWLPEPEATAYVLHAVERLFKLGMYETEILGCLLSHAPEGEIDYVIGVLRALKLRNETELLVIAAGRLAELGRTTDALALGSGIDDVGEHIDLIAAVVAHSSDDIIEELDLGAILAQAKWWELRELAEVVPAGPTRDRILGAMTTGATDIDDRAFRLTALLPLVPPEDRRDLAGEAWALVDQADPLMRDTRLTKLAPYLAQLSTDEAYRRWHDDLRRASDVRWGTLREVAVLAPLIASMGGAEQLADIAAAIEDVQRWWP